MKQLLILSLFIFILLASGCVSIRNPEATVQDSEDDDVLGSAPTVPVSEDDVLGSAPTVPVSEDDDAVLGSADAPVTMIEFSDFECSYCLRFFTQTLPQIKSNYIDTGKVKLIYRDFPLGFRANAQKAAEAAECAGDQEKFWEMHDSCSRIIIL